MGGCVSRSAAAEVLGIEGKSNGDGVTADDVDELGEATFSRYGGKVGSSMCGLISNVSEVRKDAMSMNGTMQVVCR